MGDEAVRQAKEFNRLVQSKVKEIRRTTQEEGVESHGQLNNFGLQQQISYDWLYDVFS